MDKFTFKTVKATGKWRAFNPDHHEIKFKKQYVGWIDDDPPHKIHFRVIKKDINEDGSSNCEWKWIKLKQESKSVQEAKDFVSKNTDRILKIPNLKLTET
jgi:hypothetical protein